MIQINKILVVTLSNLGDVVLTLPVFQSLYEAYPEAELHAMVGPSAGMALENDPRLHRIMIYDKRKNLAEKWKLLKQIRHEKYDLIVDLRHSWIGLLGGAKKRNSYFKFSNSNQHRVDKHLSALNGLVDKTSSTAWLLKKTSFASIHLEMGQRTVVAAVGSKSDIKKWPAMHYAKLLDRLAFEESCRIILIGDKEDSADAEKVKHLMVSPVEDRTGQTDWQTLLSVIRQASLVVTNDSAPLHIADSLKIPTLAIFGPTDPAKYGPRSPRSVALSRKIFCSPCEKAQCRFHHECLEELSPEEVYRKALQLLNDQTHSDGLKILVVRLDRLGDLVLSLPAIEALRRQYPTAHISLLTRSWTRELLEGHPLLDEVIAYEYEKKGRHRFGLGYFRFLKEIICHRFDVAFVLHPGLRSYLLAFLAGIPYRLGYQSRWGFFLTSSVSDQRHVGIRHESEYAFEVIRAFGVETPQESRATLFPSPLLGAQLASKFNLKNVRETEPWIAIHPGASCVSKRWNIERFEALGKKIMEQFSHRLIIIGGKEEKSLGHRLKVRWGNRATDLTGKLNLRELPVILQRCDLLISNDSGPVHVATAVGTRVISLFGRNQAGLSPRRWKPLGAGHVVIQKDVGCVKCLAHECPIEFECLKAIEVEEVYEKVCEMIMTSVTPERFNRGSNV